MTGRSSSSTAQHYNSAAGEFGMSDGLFTVGGTDWFTLRSAALTSSTFGVTRTGDKLVAVSRRAG